jgi:hypothetical protein
LYGRKKDPLSTSKRGRKQRNDGETDVKRRKSGQN